LAWLVPVKLFFLLSPARFNRGFLPYGGHVARHPQYFSALSIILAPMSLSSSTCFASRSRTAVSLSFVRNVDAAFRLFCQLQLSTHSFSPLTTPEGFRLCNQRCFFPPTSFFERFPPSGPLLRQRKLGLPAKILSSLGWENLPISRVRLVFSPYSLLSFFVERYIRQNFFQLADSSFSFLENSLVLFDLFHEDFSPQFCAHLLFFLTSTSFFFHHSFSASFLGDTDLFL